MPDDFDYSELTRWSRRALNYINDNYPRESKAAMRRIGQRAVRLTKEQMVARGISRKSPMYKGVKKTGVWKSGHNKWDIRTYQSSSAKHANGVSGRDYAWAVEHPHRVISHGKDTGRMTEGKRFEHQAILKTDKEFAEVLNKYIDELLDKGLALGG